MHRESKVVSSTPVTATVVQGDMRKVLAGIPECSVDSVVCDPPYELGFMGKSWDAAGIAFDPETWRAVLRVLKPGGHLVAFGGTRTHHRMMVAVEDAGFEIRDVLIWLQGQGFAKGGNISKAIDKALGVEREKIPGGIGKKSGETYSRQGGYVAGEAYSSIPITSEAKQWQGWHTGLKPAFEPIVLARKPVSERNVAANVIRWGCGGINVGASRVGTTVETWPASRAASGGTPRQSRDNTAKGNTQGTGTAPPGRWPANLILSHDPRCVQVGTERDPGYKIKRFKDGAKYFGGGAGHEYNSEQVSDGEHDVYACVPGCPVRMLDEQSGAKPSSARRKGARKGMGYHGADGDGGPAISSSSGNASRFFYTPKTSTAERVLGCPPGFANRHPTVKPLALMRWLVRLVTPPSGTVLDPFTGSGSTLVAAFLEGFTSTGVELEVESVECARGRIAAAEKYGEGLTKLKRVRIPSKRKRLPKRRSR